MRLDEIVAFVVEDDVGLERKKYQIHTVNRDSTEKGFVKMGTCLLG
jgi:hypothetical protein